MDRPAQYMWIIFALWIIPPVILVTIIFLINKFVIDPQFALFLAVPAVFFVFIAYLISTIKNLYVREGIFFSLAGALIWFSPSIYFMTASEFYLSLSTFSKFWVVATPSLILAIAFFFVGKKRAETIHLEKSGVKALAKRLKKFEFVK